MSAARPVALEIARRFLRDAGDDRSLDLASVSDQQMLRRLNVVTTEGTLTNAGALAFVGRGEPALDYTRRRHRAGDSQRRVRDHGRSLLEEIAEIEKAADAHNETRHVPHGFVIGQFRGGPAACRPRSGGERRRAP
ncbi:MAG: hypothetical protein NVV66_00250 [Cellulomonas sp.]|uniref:hypothetical protein n=1 Tax=Cellulomonas sp. TaxID=40001 RepID=UPI00258FEFD6|nr:hypothetical protein [Cellulomonas sp.]MCR6703184.1 hypothetical protein [Cellulomonas sp.]